LAVLDSDQAYDIIIVPVLIFIVIKHLFSIVMNKANQKRSYNSASLRDAQCLYCPFNYRINYNNYDHQRLCY